MKTTELPDARLNQIFMDALRDFLGMDPIFQHSYSNSTKRKHEKGIFKRGKEAT